VGLHYTIPICDHIVLHYTMRLGVFSLPWTYNATYITHVSGQSVPQSHEGPPLTNLCILQVSQGGKEVSWSLKLMIRKSQTAITTMPGLQLKWHYNHSGMARIWIWWSVTMSLGNGIMWWLLLFPAPLAWNQRKIIFLLMLPSFLSPTTLVQQAFCYEPVDW